MAESTSNMELDPKYDDYDFPTTSAVDQPGHPGHLTSEQQAQVHQLRLLLESEGYTQRLDTLTLVRLLIVGWEGLKGAARCLRISPPPVIPSPLCFLVGAGDPCEIRAD